MKLGEGQVKIENVKHPRDNFQYFITVHCCL